MGTFGPTSGVTSADIPQVAEVNNRAITAKATALSGNDEKNKSSGCFDQTTRFRSAPHDS